MTNVLKSKIAKAGLGLLVAASLFGAASAGAMTLAEAQTLISVLGLTGTQAAQVLALATPTTGGTMGTGFQFNNNLSMGMTHSDVQQLQMMLNMNPATALAVAAGANGSMGHETMYFGSATKAAVIKWQTLNGVMPTSGYFGPISRAKANSMSTTPPVVTPPVTTGPVNAMLSTDNPAAGYLVAGQATADLMHVTFTGSGTVTSMTFQRTGLSTNTALANVYLYQGATRLTDSASVNSNGVITFNGVNLAVNGSVTVSVKADVASTANGQTVGVTLTGYMVSGATGMTTSTLAGNIMSVSASGILGTVAIVSPGVTSPQVDAGVTNYTLWTAPVQISTHTMWLKSAAFHFIGSAPMDSLANIGLYVDGTKIASSTGTNSLGYIVFDLMGTPFSLTTGSHTVDVRADIVKGSYRSIQLTLQNAGDFMVTDSQVGVNVSAVSPLTSSTTFSPVSGNTVNVNQGSLSIQLDPTFTSMTSITGGASNVDIAKYNIKAYGEDEKVTTVTLTPTVAGATACASTTSLNNVALYFNGSQVGSSQNYVATALTFNLGSSMIVPAGTTGTFEVRADMQNAVGCSYSNGTVQVASATVPIGGVQGMNSLQTNASAVTIPTTTAMNIQTGVVAISANPGLATAQTVSPNASAQKIASFIVQNQSSSESVHVTNLQLSLVLGAGAGSTNYSNLMTSETSGSGNRPINPTTAAASGTSVNNFTVDFLLAPGATKTIDIMADTGATAGTTVTVQTKLVITANGASSNVALCSPSITSGSIQGCNNTLPATGQTTTVQTGTFQGAGLIISSSTPAQYVAAASTGATDATVAYYNFKSGSGTATISEMKFNVVTSSGTPITSVRVGTSSAYVVGGVAYLTGLNILVPNGGAGTNVPVYFSYSSVGTGMVTSGTFTLGELFYIKYNVGGTPGSLTGLDAVTLTNDTSLATFSAGTVTGLGNVTITVGGGTDTTLMQPGMKIIITGATNTYGTIVSITDSTHFVLDITRVGATPAGAIRFYSVPQTPAYVGTANCTALSTTDAVCMKLVGSKPTLTIVDSSAPLTNTLVKVGSVKVTADIKGDLSVNAIPVTVSSTGPVNIVTGANNITVKNAADNSIITTTNTGLAVTTGASGSDTINVTGGYLVTAGNSVTFDIYVTPTGATGSGSDALSMKLNSTASLFTWTDTAGSGTTAAENGTLIYGYPTDSSVIND